MLTQEHVLDAIDAFIRREGYPPSRQELRLALGLGSPATVQYHLDRLRDTGLLTWVPGRSRTLRILEKGEDPCSLS